MMNKSSDSCKDKKIIDPCEQEELKANLKELSMRRSCDSPPKTKFFERFQKKFKSKNQKFS